MKNVNRMSWILVGVLLLIGIILFVNTSKQKVALALSDAQQKELVSKNASLKDSLTKIEAVSKQKEDSLTNYITLINSDYKNKIIYITNKYNVKHDEIKKLGLNDQITLLRENIGLVDSLPSIQVINGDTSIAIGVDQGVLVNEKFEELWMLGDMNDAKDTQIENLNIAISKYDGVITSKNAEISVLKQISENDNTLLQKAKDDALLQKKLTRKKVFKGVLGGTAAGLVIGIVVTLIL